MEKETFYTPNEDPDDEPESKKPKKPVRLGEMFVKSYTRPLERPVAALAARHHSLVPLEGIINWREEPKESTVASHDKSAEHQPDKTETDDEEPDEELDEQETTNKVELKHLELAEDEGTQSNSAEDLPTIVDKQELRNEYDLPPLPPIAEALPRKDATLAEYAAHNEASPYRWLHDRWWDREKTHMSNNEHGKEVPSAHNRVPMFHGTESTSVENVGRIPDPQERSRKISESVVARPNTFGAWFATFLGIEYFARKRADRELERHFNEQVKEQDARTEAALGQFESRLFQRVPQPHSERLREQAFDNRESLHDVRTEYSQQERHLAAPSPEVTKTASVSERTSTDHNLAMVPSANQRIERSAWHNIIVDRQGREVTKAIEYGQAFQRERKQEILGDDVAPPDSAGVAVSRLAHQQQDATAVHYDTRPLPIKKQSNHHTVGLLPKQIVSDLSNAWLGAIIALVVVAFLMAAFL